MKIEVLFFDGCPNHGPALGAVESVLEELGMAADVQSIPVRGEADAAARGFVGSPTIRIDDVDVEPGGAAGAPRMACRVYRTASGMAGVPDRETLRAALERARRRRPEETSA